MQKNQLMATISIVVIVAAIGLVVWQMKKGGGGADIQQSQEAKAAKFMFHCTACGNEFKKPDNVDLAMVMPGQPIKCPKCGKDAAYQMIRCVHCNKWFFAKQVTKGYTLGQLAPTLKCPFCHKLALKK